MKFLCSIFILFCSVVTSVAAQNDSIEKVHKGNFFKGVGKAFGKVMKAISPDFDTLYIEPQKYSFTVMAQGTQTYDHFILKSGDVDLGDIYSLDLAPDSKTSVGPYLGWQWIFLGYSFNVKTMNVSKHEFDINASFYTPSLGIDVVYRNLGSDYYLRDLRIGSIKDVRPFKDMRVEGLDIDVMALNIYYVLNPKKYSHQAVYNQTNRQIRSAGSWIVGSGFSKNSYALDWDGFHRQIQQVSHSNEQFFPNDSTLFFDKISYTSIPLTFGYGYNWTFSKNWCAAAQALASLSYMWTHGDAKENSFTLKNMIKEMSFSNFTFDGSLRLGIVWNNTRWFAGANMVYHTFNYRNEHLSAYNIFGTMHLYVGYNF